MDGVTTEVSIEKMDNDQWAVRAYNKEGAFLADKALYAKTKDLAIQAMATLLEEKALGERKTLHGKRKTLHAVLEAKLKKKKKKKEKRSTESASELIISTWYGREEKRFFLSLYNRVGSYTAYLSLEDIQKLEGALQKAKRDYHTEV